MGSGNILPQTAVGPRGGDKDRPGLFPERRNAPLNAAVIETASGEKIIGLHDSREHDTAQIGLQKEQPWHRMAAHMLNKGFSNVEVADAAGVDKQSISMLRAQRWFNELCATLAEDKDKAIRARIDGYALDAVEAIAEVAFGPDEYDSIGRLLIPKRVRLTAQQCLLEQSLGRPTQKVLSVSATTSFSSERQEYDSIMAELHQLAPGIIPTNDGGEAHAAQTATAVPANETVSP